MGRINILFIGRDQKTSADFRKVTGRSFRDLAFFEVETREEARRLLARFRIHLVLSDQTSTKKELGSLKKQFPEIPFIKTGNEEDESGEGIIHIPFSELRGKMKEFLKNYKKDNPLRFVQSAAPSTPESFGDYSSLLSGL